jgi:hypothetical protein
MRALTLRHARAARWLFWSAMVALSALIVANTLPYFSFRTNFAFLLQREDLARDATWRACFYAHLCGGIICLAAGPFLVWGAFLRASPAMHRVLGRAYVMSVLGCSGPASVYLALHAQGGIAGKLGFLTLAIGWLATTARGLQLVVRKRFAEHRVWMIRSYALTLSAVFFRAIHVALYAAGVDDQPNYVVSLWLSLAASLAAGEILARVPSRTRAVLSLEGRSS